MINILKQVGNYSLVENTSKGKSSLRFYVDNGEEVSEYFDILEAQELFDIDDEEFFVGACEEYV